MNLDDKIRIRPANAEDAPFIFNSMLKSFRNSNFARHIANEVYFSEHHKIIEGLLKSNQVLMACNKNDPSQLFGYIIAGEVEGFFVLHYIYVKHSFRNMGMGKLLLNSFNHNPDNASIYTHHTRICERLAPKFNFVYHPYLIMNIEENADEQD